MICRRRLVRSGVCAGVLAAVLLARQPAIAAADDPAAPIGALHAALLAAMKAGPATGFQQRYSSAAPIIDQVFDLPEILRVSVGPRWASIPPAQQGALEAVFERFTVASYLSNFNSFGGERFEILPARRRVGADVVVPTRLLPASGDPVRIDYVMRAEAGAWRVIDVLLDGSISRVAVQRSDFRALLAAGDASRLIASLQRKVAALSGGALAT